MKAHSKTILLIFIGLAVTFQFALAEKIDPKTHDVIPESGDELYNRAPTPLPWIDAEMLTTEYWVKRMKNPDEVILSKDAIHGMNEKWQTRLSQDDPFADEPDARKPELIHWWPGFSLRKLDLSSYNGAALADTVRVKIEDEIEYLYKRPYGNALAVRYSTDQLQAFENEMALAEVDSQISVRHGITVRASRLRNIPSFFPIETGVTQSMKTRWDQWNIGFLNIGLPVQVLHVSKSGEHLFVLSEEGYGWMRSENIALASKNVINKFVTENDFAIATKGRVLFFADSGCTMASGWMGLGCKLPIVISSDPIKVKVPVRKMDGSLDFETAWMPKNNNVNIGYVPYTRRNIVEIAFKQLGDTYDWSGAWFGRQHERAYSDVFACFGFELPNHGSLFTFYNDNNKTMLTKDMGEEKYIDTMSKNSPFVTFQSCNGHCLLYLGNDDDGRPIMFDQHGYGYQDDDEEWWEIRRTNIGDIRFPRYFLSNDVTFLELR